MPKTFRRRSKRGFTLLEVLLATSIMAVGTTSVLVVIATAAGMASQRQVNARREEVLDEARHEAQVIVDSFRPGVAVATQKPAAEKAAATPAKGTTPVRTTPAVRAAPENVTGRTSSRFGGFNYDLTFKARDPVVPEKGYDVGITIHYGGGELSYSAATTMISTTIPDEEFLTSRTYEAERQGLENKNKTRETK